MNQASSLPIGRPLPLPLCGRRRFNSSSQLLLSLLSLSFALLSYESSEIIPDVAARLRAQIDSLRRPLDRVKDVEQMSIVKQRS